MAEFSPIHQYRLSILSLFLFYLFFFPLQMMAWPWMPGCLSYLTNSLMQPLLGVGKILSYTRNTNLKFTRVLEGTN